MIDLHTHTVFSDGELIPFELARRAEALGIKTIAITDHVDASNIGIVVPALAKAAEKLKGHMGIEVIPGAELTHIPPKMIKQMVSEARLLGARIVVVHGETIVEPVARGTNRAAMLSGADILSHPGLITDKDAMLAKKMGVALEITARKGHCLTNGLVAKTALACGAMLVINTDSHSPSDLITDDIASLILRGAGLDEKQIRKVFLNSISIADKALRRSNA